MTGNLGFLRSSNTQAVGTQSGDAVVDINKMPFTTMIDEYSSTVTYIGYAMPGTSASAALWRVKKITVSGTVTSIQWAGGDNNFAHVWDDRLSLTYS